VHIVVTAGAISLGAVLGVLLAQRTSTRARTLAALLAAVVTVSGAAALVAGSTAAVVIILVAPIGYTLRRLFDA
jgi:hypothetical protein